MVRCDVAFQKLLQFPPYSRARSIGFIGAAGLLLALLGFGSAFVGEAAGASSSVEEAQRHRLAGDAFVKSDQLDKAADAYIQALDISRESFSTADRTRMAIYLSWADRLDRAENELRLVLAAEPANREARIQLARVLSWKGQLRAAIEEADLVLRESPGNRDALQVKADALQWQGNLRRAIPLYRELLNKQDAFDARLGLAQALLAARDRMGAEEAGRGLSGETGSQRSRLEKFRREFDETFRPKLDARYSRFTDSDNNRLDRYSAAPSFWLGNFDLGAFYRHTEANDDRRYKRVDEFSLRAYTNLNESVGVGGQLGLAHLSRGSSATFPAGEVRVDAMVVPGGRLGASVTREVLTDSAELIENRIRATFAMLRWAQNWTDRLATTAVYRYGTLSDSNHLHDARLTTEYFLWLKPKVSIGHRFRYANFQRQSRGGYFDPNDYYSNRGFVSFYMEQERFYSFAEVFAGQQAFKRNGFPSKDTVYGGAASLGFKPTRAIALEFSVEGGQLAAATSSGAGYSYLIFGPRCLIRF